MKRTGWRLLVLAGFLSSLVGCSGLLGGKAVLPQLRKFIIEAEPLRLSIPESGRPYPFKVEVGDFEVSRLYDRDQIVFRLSPQEIKEDRYHRWAVRPGEMITDAVEQYLKDARLFTDIRQEFLDTPPDFKLTGTVKAIERFDSGDLWYAHLAMSMQLVDGRNEVVEDWPLNSVKQVYVADFSHTVVTLSQILRNYMEEVIRGLNFHFLIRELQRKNLPFEHLLDKRSAAGPVAETSAPDTANVAPLPQLGYEIIPGKLAPESP